MSTISLQPGQPGNGLDYDPTLPLPYPIHMDEDGLCWNVPGHALRDEDPDDRPRLIGFQSTAEPDPTGLLLRNAWLDGEVEACEGMWPVFAHKGQMFNLTEPITNVSVSEVASR